MEKAKVKVLHAAFPYAGNGGFSSNVDDYSDWWARTAISMHCDDRISSFSRLSICDTPITMTRNRAVNAMHETGSDFLLMADSDMHFDFEFPRDPYAKLFWDTAFDFAYERLVAGLPTVIAAPYCGPPPNEVVYIFEWNEHETPYEGSENWSPFSLDMVPRTRAALLSGIQPCDAAGTGLILYSANAFDLMEPPYFDYEWKDKKLQHEKSSTEDVYNTREISMAGREKYREHVLFCAWDCWSSHVKQKKTGKPRPIPREAISSTFRRAILDNISEGERMQWLGNDYPAEPLDLAKTNGKPEEPEKAEPIAVMIGDHKFIPSLQPLSEDEGIAIRNLASQAVDSTESPARIACVFPVDGEVPLHILDGGDSATTIYCPGPTIEPRDVWVRCQHNLGHIDQVKLMDQSAIEVAELFSSPQELDLVVLDLRFDQRDAIAALKAWEPHVRKNGIMIVLADEDVIDSLYAESTLQVQHWPKTRVYVTVPNPMEITHATQEEATD